MKLLTVTLSGKEAKEIESPIFDRAGDKTLVAQAVRVYLSNQRSGTAKVKTRAEVNLTKKKWFKQKGTGNARHGAQSAPIFVGGGVAHGPNGTTNWKLSMSQSMRTRALETVLAFQAKAEKVQIVQGFESLVGKTKEVVSALKALKLQSKAVLLVTEKATDELLRATQNISNILVINSKDLSTFYVARAQAVLITPEGLSALETRLGTKKQEEVAPKAKSRTKKVAKSE